MVRGLLVGVAGFAGALLRYWVDGVVSRAARGAFPRGTWVVNVTGCFLLGVLATVLTGRILPYPALRVAVTAGFVGAYTTFSTLVYESVQLGRGGAAGLAALNILASLAAGVAACWAGIAVGRVL